MKKVLVLMLALVLVLSLAACGGETKTKELTTDDCVGTWLLDSGNGIVFSSNETSNQIEIIRGGVANAYVKSNAYVECNWEIVDNALKISHESMGMGTTFSSTFVFEVDGDTMTSLDAYGSVYKKK